MRVLLLGPYPPPHGGVQTHLVAIKQHLEAYGASCQAINITRHRREDSGGVYYPKSATALLGLLLRLDYDVIHLHLGGDLTPRLLALCLVCCSMPGKRTVLTFHSGGFPSSPAGRAARPASRIGFVFRRFDRLIGVNLELAAMFERFGVPRERIRMIFPHSLDVAVPGEMPEPIAHFFATHRPVLLSVGLLEPEYDLALQIDVLGAVRDRFPQAGLVMIGSGSLEGELRRRMAAKPYAEHLLLPGDVPHTATLRAIATCDVLLRTTLYDGDSVAVREALHLATPVIATDNGMRPPGVELIPASDPPALVEAIERRLRAGRGAVAAAAETGEENIAAVVEVYRELLGKL